MILQYITTIICLVAAIALIAIIIFERKYKTNNNEKITNDNVPFEDFYKVDIDEETDTFNDNEDEEETNSNLERTFSDFDLFKKPVAVHMFDDDEDDEFDDYEDIQINVVNKSDDE